MSKIAVLLIVLAAALSANPTMEYFLSEIQVAPDSLERVEIHMYSRDRQYPVDLSGWQIATNAGSATIDSGVMLQDTEDFVTISRENTTGTFSLGDSTDEIALHGSGGDIRSYTYNGDDGWAPPAGMSVAVYAHWEGIWPDEYVVCDWYLDSTPTFGAPNDDRYGGIAGRVLDRFGEPLRWCSVSFRNRWGSAYAGCDSTGRYVMSPLGPGTYQVRAHSDSTYMPVYYPESVSIGVNKWRDSIDMTMYPVGLAEGRGVAKQAILVHQRGRMLVLAADRPGAALVSVYDNLGRVRTSEKVSLASGSNELALPSLRSGVYFASCRFRERTLKTKLVLY
jgi:hypothetical protein